MRRRVYAFAIAVAAALLFAVQPMAGRFLLPTVGGSTVVWSAALVFFQAALLAGYFVAHGLTKVPRNVQPFLFVGGLAIAALVLPFELSGRVPDWSSPGGWVVGELALMVGAPFLMLSVTSPLLQRWYSQLDEPDAHEPYGLYAASNIGSILGLLSYPLLVEPLATLDQQALGWAVGFVILILLITGCAALSRDAVEVAANEEPVPAPAWSRRIWWLVCAALPSSLLVSMTANITADIAPVPLLWVVPLVVYLASYVWVFSSRAPRHEHVETVLVAVVLPYAALSAFDPSKPWWLFAPLAVLVLGIIATAYHGELMRTRPEPQHLTMFYLYTSLGGVLGGATATFGATAIFDTLLELPMELMLAVALLPWSRKYERRWPVVGVSLALVVVVSLIASATGTFDAPELLTLSAAVSVGAIGMYAFDMRLGWVALALTLIAAVSSRNDQDIGAERSPYGRYKVVATTNDQGTFHELLVGRVVHGTQAQDEALLDTPLAYYHPSSPLGQMMDDPVSDGPVAVIGLGIGALAPYARDDRHITFFEIDPVVHELAANPDYFSHLDRCGEHCTVGIGDGRLLVRGLEDDSVALLVLDAFSGDAIPTHLITVQALQMYKTKLRPGGAIIMNVSNMYIDMPHVTANAAAATGLRAFIQGYSPGELRDLNVAVSNWAVLTDNEALIRRLTDDPKWKPAKGDPSKAWTDDWQNLFAHYTWQ